MNHKFILCSQHKSTTLGVKHPLLRLITGLSLTATALSALAAPPTSGAYTTDVTQTYVQDATTEALKQPNTVLCYMLGTGANKDAVVNQGAYPLMIDANKCDNSGGGSSATSDDSSTLAPKYSIGVATSTRADNNSPLIGSLWLTETNNGTPDYVFAKLSASQAPSATSTYGKFHTDYCGVFNSSATNCNAAYAFRGFAEGDGGNVLSYHVNQSPQFSSENSVNLNGNTSAGSGRAKFTETQGNNSKSGDWKFAYNADYFRRANNSDGSNDQCFSRSATDADRSTWRYGVYNADGSRLERNSGFPIKTSDGKFGYVGYYGANVQGGASLANGDSVTRFSYSGGQSSQATYTVVKTDGRLKKLTKKSTTLGAIKNVPFYAGVMAAFTDSGSVSRSPGQMLELKWNGTNFVITGTASGGGMPTPDSRGYFIPSAVFQNSTGNDPNNPVITWPAPVIMGYSQALGGAIKIPLKNPGSDSTTYLTLSDTSNVFYRTETILQPGGTGWPVGGHATIPGNLICIQDCPKGVADFQAQVTSGTPYANFIGTSTSSRFNGQPVLIANALKYSANSTTGVLYGLSASGNTFTEDQTKPVTWTTGTSTSFPGGFQSGLMVDSNDSTALTCTIGNVSMFCPWKIDNVATVYQWETGPNSFNGLTALKDSSNNVLSFDPPMRLSFTVPLAATGNMQSFAGATLNLQYNGFGELFGIPGYCVNPSTNARSSTCSQTDRWVAAFSLALGAELSDGTNTYYVRPLEQELRLKNVTANNPNPCLNLSLPTIADNAMPSITGWVDPVAAIGAKPSASGATRVIDGDVKY